MRHAAILATFAALTLAAPARADTASDIAAIEEAWAEALRKGDTPYLESLLAPEFKLLRAEPGPVEHTLRDYGDSALIDPADYRITVTVH